MTTESLAYTLAVALLTSRHLTSLMKEFMTTGYWSTVINQWNTGKGHRVIYENELQIAVGLFKKFLTKCAGMELNRFRNTEVSVKQGTLYYAYEVKYVAQDIFPLVSKENMDTEIKLLQSTILKSIVNQTKRKTTPIAPPTSRC